MRKGFILQAVVSILLVFLIMIPAILRWVTDDTKNTIREDRKSKALYLAEAAVERGYWKVKSATSTFELVVKGGILQCYRFDCIFDDIEGGKYRIFVSSGPNEKEITIVGEANVNGEIRAIKSVFENRTVYSPILTNGNFISSEFLVAFWGPIYVQGDYRMTTANIAKLYFPRKYAKGNILGHGSFVRDTNGPNPPNTDNVEWWSYYKYIPEVPLIDFSALRSSASVTQTLNRYDLKNEFSGAPCKTTTGPLGGNYSICKKFPLQTSTTTPKVWYWDGDVVFEGYEGSQNCSNHGFYGTIIIRGNLTVRSAGCYKFSGPVPQNAYLDHYKLLQNVYDTAASDEYPGDIGFQVTKSSFNFGTERFRPFPGESNNWIHTVGVRGFTYVGGNLNIVGPWGYMDFVGAVWVVGNVTVTGGSGWAFCGVFYNDKLELPTLNVILINKSWQEIPPSGIPWG